MEYNPFFEKTIEESWHIIAPLWPLSMGIARNPLQGFEHLPFEDGVKEGLFYFSQKDASLALEEINRQTIKWCQAFFDTDQAAISMPHTEKGLLRSWKNLSVHDTSLHHSDKHKIEWLKHLSVDPAQTIVDILRVLGVKPENHVSFLKMVLCSLSGWAGYVKYLAEWSGSPIPEPYIHLKKEYLAVRLAITYLVCPDAARVLCLTNNHKKPDFELIYDNEKRYKKNIVDAMQNAPSANSHSNPDAQFVFCIDVRSEPIRRTIEQYGNYETFGFAGFFGLPIKIKKSHQEKPICACPVLIQPKHTVEETTNHTKPGLLVLFKKIYQSLKYNFVAPFALIEAIGPLFAPLLIYKNIVYRFFYNHAEKKVFFSKKTKTCDFSGISFSEQCTYARGALELMGMTSRFAQTVVFVGHASQSENNPYAATLDCGACGGNPGGANATLLADILNQEPVRNYLREHQIFIPKDTRFVGAQHNTTTDLITLYLDANVLRENTVLQKITKDLTAIQKIQSSFRLSTLDTTSGTSAYSRSVDWAQTRPEWGLAKNACFIVAARSFTQAINLEGRAFLHSYDWEKDLDGTFLETILTAPMIVAHWINAQYLFSTLDNVSFGGGSKITQNITGKIGVMQGNASDLLDGLPLESVYASDTTAYHEPLRLLTLVVAPAARVSTVIQRQPILQKLLGNKWVLFMCKDPQTHALLSLESDFSWKKEI